ncbi:Alpha/Beta hydrolase protein [Biscogniauxia mediterranea]|nr:Alpha/Beta hydrolase protein [Biscogniauxia mediterranea]
MRSASRSTLIGLLVAVGGPVFLYASLISILSIPSFEARVLYQHRRTSSPFNIATPDRLTLHAWHILPIGLYYKHITDLQNGEGGLEDIEQTLNFRLLRDDPEARLVLHCHGATGDLGWSWRPDNHRALGLRLPINSTLLLSTTGVSGSRKGHQRKQVEGIITSGVFTNVPTISTPYRVAGFLPVAMPLAKFPVLMNYFGRLVEYVQSSERYHIQLIHAEDNPIVPVSHCDELFRNAKGLIRQEAFKFGLHDKVLSFPLNGIAVLRASKVFDPNFAA